jgi:hypothetical protein
MIRARKLFPVPLLPIKAIVLTPRSRRIADARKWRDFLIL